MVAESAVNVLDEVVALLDQAQSAKFGAAENRMRDELDERGKTGEDRQALLDDTVDRKLLVAYEAERPEGIVGVVSGSAACSAPHRARSPAGPGVGFLQGRVVSVFAGGAGGLRISA